MDIPVCFITVCIKKCTYALMRIIHNSFPRSGVGMHIDLILLSMHSHAGAWERVDNLLLRRLVDGGAMDIPVCFSLSNPTALFPAR